MPSPEASGERLKADAVLLVLTGVWALTFVVVKDALQLADPFTWLTLRFFVGASALTLIAGRRLWTQRNVLAGLGMGVVLWASFAMQTVGLMTTTPSRSAFLTGLFVVLTPFTSTVMFKRIPRLPSLAGAALAFAGTYWLTTGGSHGTTSSFGLGEILSIGCALGYSIHLSLMEKYAASSSPIPLTALQLWVVFALSAIAIPLFGTPRLELTMGLVGSLLYAGIVASAIAIAVQTWGQARTTAVHAAVVFATEPAFAALYSVALGREVLGSREIAGGLLILAGVLVSEVGGALWTSPQPSS